MPIIKSVVSVALILASQQIASGNEPGASQSFGVVERAIVFAVQQEVKANNLLAQRDLCIGFGQGLEVDQKAILSTLRRTGIRVRPNEWCNQGPRGVRVGIAAPIDETPPGTYTVNVQVDDLSIQPGEHFATTLRRGTYVIRCETGFKPHLGFV